jgi:integrase
MQQLKTKPGIAALALQFTILTAVRSGPVRAATWDQINLEDRVWTIPAMHMKAKRPFRAVLNEQAIEVIKPLMGASDYVFPGGKIGKPLSENGMLAVLKRMGRTDITVHGFRSTFRDHIGEETDFDRFVTEFAMAHVVGDSTERAYARGDQLRKRFDIMEAWGNYVMSGSCE